VEIARQAMASGADKVSVTTSAIDNPDLISDLAHQYGSQAVVVGIDVKETSGGLVLYDHRTRASLPQPVETWVNEVQQRGCGEIRVSFVEREGMRNGFALDAVRKLRSLIKTPFVIEGGAGNLDHVDEVFDTKIDAISLGTMLIFSDNNIVQIKRHLEARKRNIRQW
jgi:cyclase